MRKFLRKITALLSVTAVAAGMASAPLMAEAQGAKTELVFWHGMGGTNGEALQKIVDQFNASQNEITVNAQYQGSYDETLTKLRSTASGQAVGADLVQVFEVGSTFMIDSKLTVPVQDYVDKTKFDLSQLEPNLLAYFTIDGKLNSMPFNNSTPLMYYNAEMFKKAGIEVPETMEEMIAAAPKLQEAGASMAASISVYGWWIDQLFNKMGLDIFNSGNGRDGAPTEVEFVKNGGMEKILTMWKKGLDEGAFPNVGRTGGIPEFVGGQSAMTWGSTASLRQILNEVGGRFEVGTAYFPGVDSKDTHGVSIGGASLWMIDSGNDAKKDATWTFIQYLVSPDVQAQWNVDTGYFPVNIKAQETQMFKDNLAKYPQFKTAIDQLHDSKPEDAGALAGVAQESRQIFESLLENVLEGSKTPGDAAKEMETQINAAIENYNKANKQ